MAIEHASDCGVNALNYCTCRALERANREIERLSGLLTDAMALLEGDVSGPAQLERFLCEGKAAVDYGESHG